MLIQGSMLVKSDQTGLVQSFFKTHGLQL